MRSILFLAAPLLLACGSTNSNESKLDIVPGEAVNLQLSPDENVKTGIMSVVTEMNMMKMDMKTEMDMYFQFSFIKRHPDTLENTSALTRVVMRQSGIPGMPAEGFDTDSPDGGGMLTETVAKSFSGMINAKIRTLLSPKGKVYSTDTPEGLEEILASSGGVGNTSSPWQTIFPEKPVAPGDSWSSILPNTGGDNAAPLSVTYTLLKVQDGIAYIHMETEPWAEKHRAGDMKDISTLSMSGQIELNLSDGLALLVDTHTEFGIDIKNGAISMETTAKVHTTFTMNPYAPQANLP